MTATESVCEASSAATASAASSAAAGAALTIPVAAARAGPWRAAARPRRRARAGRRWRKRLDRTVSGASLPPITMKLRGVAFALTTPCTCAAIADATRAFEPTTLVVPGVPRRNGSGYDPATTGTCIVAALSSER